MRVCALPDWRRQAVRNEKCANGNRASSAADLIGLDGGLFARSRRTSSSWASDPQKLSLHWPASAVRRVQTSPPPGPSANCRDLGGGRVSSSENFHDLRLCWLAAALHARAALRAQAAIANLFQCKELKITCRQLVAKSNSSAQAVAFAAVPVFSAPREKKN